jgi:DNA-binding NtrC family response regulator
MEHAETWVERENRIPLYVPVHTDPPLADCWAVNLSLSGIGLVAARDRNDPPSEGAVVDVRLTLPGGELVRMQGEVQWSHSGSAAGPGAFALGLRFVAVTGAARSALRQYLDAYRPRVAVVGASAPQREHVESALAQHLYCHFVGDGELDEVLARGDVSAVVVCGEDAAQARGVLGRFVADGARDVGPTPASDLTPRMVFAAPTSDASVLVEAFNRGALFAVVPPPDASTARQLKVAVLRACAEHGVRTEQHRGALALERALARERARTRPQARLDTITRRSLIVESDAMAAVIESVRRVAPHRIAVLLEGETGTGKELLARLLHELSDRADAAYVAQDCGALTETLLESELFGHVKGAFTGAISPHPGLFVMADGGTIFLDEVENTSANMQAKLLRVIETGEVRPVGGSKVRRVDVRVLAASNCDLAVAMGEGRMRADLYFRLTTFPIRVPPLRQRTDDILPLARHFLALASAGFGRDPPALTAPVERALVAHSWPGNVRELRNTMERAALLIDGGRLDLDALPDTVRYGLTTASAPAGEGSLRELLERVEADIIRTTLARHRGVVRRAAIDLDANPVTLARRARKLGLL